MATPHFTAQGFLLRFVLAVVLVFATYNPEGYSYFDWALKPLPAFSVPKLFLGVVLLIGWVVYIRATLRSLGPIGLTLAFAFFGSLLWLVVDYGLVPADSVRALSYLIEVVLCGVLAIGMSWSHIRRRMSGQADMDDLDEG